MEGVDAARFEEYNRSPASKSNAMKYLCYLGFLKASMSSGTTWNKSPTIP